MKDGLHQLGAFRLLLGAEPHSGADVGLRPNPQALKARLKGDLEAEPFTEATLKLVEELIAFLRADKVRGPALRQGLPARQGVPVPPGQGRARTTAPIGCGPSPPSSAPATSPGPGLVSNRELNLVHRVILPTEDAVDREAAERVAYLEL